MEVLSLVGPSKTANTLFEYLTNSGGIRLLTKSEPVSSPVSSFSCCQAGDNSPVFIIFFPFHFIHHCLSLDTHDGNIL